MKITFLIILILPLSVFAQKKESNEDLREVKTSFLIKEESSSLSLKSENGSYYLEKNRDSKFRLATKFAKESELEFNAIFLKFKYELPESKVQCKQQTQMEMLGENYQFCKDDKKRSELLQEYIAKLNKYLK